MTAHLRYHNVDRFVRLCEAIGISTDQVARRAGLSDGLVTEMRRGVNAREYFAIWEAAVQVAERPDLPLELARIIARGPFVSAVFAFCCSPTVEIGLTRLALFKPLVAPIRLDLDKKADSFEIRFRSADRQCPIPQSMAPFEIAYFLELLRNHTARHIVPLKVEMPGSHVCQAEFETHFGVRVNDAPVTRLVLSSEDAERPLITQNEEMWAEFEPSLRRQLRERDQSAPMGDRVKSLLLEMLPSGQSSVEQVCDRLNLSKRSLQRQLKREGVSFQSILDATRSELSLHYLSKAELSVEEISYLLAYRDPNSFYRAFHTWTGMTPMQARGLASH